MFPAAYTERITPALAPSLPSSGTGGAGDPQCVESAPIPVMKHLRQSAEKEENLILTLGLKGFRTPDLWLHCLGAWLAQWKSAVEGRDATHLTATGDQDLNTRASGSTFKAYLRHLAYRTPTPSPAPIIIDLLRVSPPVLYLSVVRLYESRKFHESLTLS